MPTRYKFYRTHSFAPLSLRESTLQLFNNIKKFLIFNLPFIFIFYFIGVLTLLFVLKHDITTLNFMARLKFFIVA